MTYAFNSTEESSFISRGAVVSGLLIYLLPAAFGADSIWFAMPITELLVAVFVITMMRCYTKQLSNGNQK